jgi:hypothetical protein
VKNDTNTGIEACGLATDPEPEPWAARPAYDSLKPVELHSAGTARDPEHEITAMRAAVAKQRTRAALTGGGALFAIAALGFGLFGFVAEQEQTRARERVQSHVTAAQPPAAAMDLPKAAPAKEPEAPAPTTSEIPKNGGTPAWVLVAPGDRAKQLRRKK